jgi:TRAP-type C4-dicarboxylate transport system permease small subunit
MTSFLRAVTDTAYRIVKGTAAALLFFYFVLVLLQIFFRYVLNSSLAWSEEVVRFGLVWGVMLSMAVVAYDRAHIRIAILESVLSQRTRLVLTYVLDTLSVLFCVLLLWSSLELIRRTLLQRSPSLGVPMWAVYISIAIGAALQAIFTVAVFGRAVKSHAQVEGDK